MLLGVNKLSKSFGANQVLKDISFGLDAGVIATLVGPNGSGKTTMFNILSGFLKPDSGSIQLDGQELVGLSAVKTNRAGVCRTFQDLRLINDLTVKENVLLAFKHNPGESFLKALVPGRLYKKSTDDFELRADEILAKCFIAIVANNKAGEISYGQQKLLTLACCMANDPDVYLLDEPVAGINPQYRQQMVDMLKQLKSQGKTIFLVEHNTEFIEAVSDQLFFLNNGTLAAYPSYEALKKDTLVKEAYL